MPILLCAAFGRGSVGAPSPACGIRHTAYGCGFAALCLCGEAI
ncbi:MAG: hypothetical protein ACR2L2_05920 [Acidobacteriota bacterium]